MSVDRELVERVARRAGSMALEGFRNRDALVVERKEAGVNNVVTDMDLRSEQLIRRELSAESSARFMGEESASEIDYAGQVWIVDPIDGTVNYAYGIPLWTVSIALVDDGVPVLGVVFDPNRDELYSAVRGGGAFCNGRPIGCTDTANLERALLVTGFPYEIAENPHGAIDTFAHVLRSGIAVRRLGSAALDLAWLAAGRYDGFWEVSLNPWDVAAGILLVREAGGRVGSYADVTDPDPDRIVTDRLLATNGTIHEPLRSLLREA